MAAWKDALRVVLREPKKAELRAAWMGSKMVVMKAGWTEASKAVMMVDRMVESWADRMAG